MSSEEKQGESRDIQIEFDQSVRPILDFVDDLRALGIEKGKRFNSFAES
jgi:hypothetical protein